MIRTSAVEADWNDDECQGPILRSIAGLAIRMVDSTQTLSPMQWSTFDRRATLRQHTQTPHGLSSGSCWSLPCSSHDFETGLETEGHVFFLLFKDRMSQ